MRWYSHLALQHQSTKLRAASNEAFCYIHADGHKTAPLDVSSGIEIFEEGPRLHERSSGVAPSQDTTLTWFTRAGKLESFLTAAEVAKVELPLAQIRKSSSISTSPLPRSVPPPGQGGGIDEPTNHWRVSPFVGNRLPAREYASGTRDIVILLSNDWSEDRPQTTRTQLDAKRTYESKAIKSKLDALLRV